MVIENANGPLMEKIKKKLHKIFKSEGLKVQVETNLETANFLDVCFDLKNQKHSPYRKPNSFPLYINSKSNHPPCIIKQMPKTVEQRLTANPSDKEVFDRAKPDYETALMESGYDGMLKYDQGDKSRGKTKTKRKSQRSRKITWYNPPFSMDVRTNIGKRFLGMIDKHFNVVKLSKIINRNTVKISYCCLPNVSHIIKSHNKSLLDSNTDNIRGEDASNKQCNCRTGTECPLDGKCLSRSLVYEATLHDRNGNKFTYIGLTEGTFKSRYNRHT